MKRILKILYLYSRKACKTIRPPTSPPESLPSFLVIKPSSLGDIIHTLPAVYELAQAFSQSSIGWIVNSEYAPLLSLAPYVDEVIPFERRRFQKKSFPSWLPNFLQFVRSFRHRYSTALDFQGLFRSGLMTWLSGCEKRIGFDSAREGATLFYSHSLSLPPNLSVVEENAHLLSALPIRRTPSPGKAYLEVAPSLFANLARRFPFLQRDLPLLCLAPGARWKSKLWPPRKFASLIDGLASEISPLKTALLGTDRETPLAREILAYCQTNPFDLTGQTSLPEVAALLTRSRLFIGGDTGTLHLASLMGTPVVSLFGPTYHRRVFPWGSPSRIVFEKVDCLGCHQRVCPRPVHLCMEKLAVEKVKKASVDLWKSFEG